MIKKHLSYLLEYYPQNYIIRKPLVGALVIGFFFFLFTVIYKPLEAHPSKSFTYLQTMALYALCAALSIFISISLVKRMSWLADKNKWSLLKELVGIFMVIGGSGLFLYGFGFIMEPPGARFNLLTFFYSVKAAFMLEVLPMVFFTAINYGHLNKPVAVCDPHEEAHSFKSSSEEKIIEVASQLKKEELRFRPDEFLYAEAEGNYVTFYLKSKDTIKKVMIRNSISNIARQLSHYPFFFRSHRAYIINLNMVHSKHGNALGYRLKIEGVHFEIPVSRSNIKSFDHRYTLCQC